MICNKCGAKNSDARVKCFHCGAILDNNNVNETSLKTAPVIEEFTVENVIEEDINEDPFVVEEQQEKIVKNDISVIIKQKNL